MTYHLQRCEVFLPPQVPPDLRSHGRQHIVRVHYDVNECVQKAKERRVTARSELDSEPHRHGHHSVVDNVQC